MVSVEPGDRGRGRLGGWHKMLGQPPFFSRNCVGPLPQHTDPKSATVLGPNIAAGRPKVKLGGVLAHQSAVQMPCQRLDQALLLRSDCLSKLL